MFVMVDLICWVLILSEVLLADYNVLITHAELTVVISFICVKLYVTKKQKVCLCFFFS